MRSVWFRGTALAASALLALAMLLLNYGFEAAGSVPDLEGCGFLAGSLGSLIVLYPLTAAVVAAWSLRPLARRFPGDEARIARCGGRIAIAGAGIYFGLGILFSVLRDADPLPMLTWPVLLTLTGACWAGGRIGARRCLRQLAWRDVEA